MKTRAVLLISDVLSLSASFFLAFKWFHLDARLKWLVFTVFVTAKIGLFIRFGLYRAILKFAGMPLASNILKATTLVSLLGFALLSILSAQVSSPGFFVMDYLISSFLVGIIRFAPRYLSEMRQEGGSKRVLIYGAGDLGEEVARKLLRNPEEYQLTGFIDDNPEIIGKKLHNLPIFGPMSELNRILARNPIAELIIAIASLEGEAVRNITGECRRNGVFCRIVPSFSDMLKQDVSIKNLDISDLLKRDPKDLDETQIRRFLKGKTIMISGAGGSIGSELSRQCVRYGAGKLVLIDHSEFNLYALQEELALSSVPVRFCLLNVSNGALEGVMKEERPQIFFHAAAYKHVPIVEDNPGEGLLNNVRGTIATAQLAERHGVEKFVLISTDKAVRPTSVMGASKRIAELYVQNLDARSKTEYVAVRFGNVLGSSGSVIPKFIEQINRGGPVTVTHPEVTRYFMLTSEAVQLVLQAASIGNGGEIFILNMGKPVRIADMAEDLIFLAGREPHKDIQIEYTGLRPGEKLYEELIVDETEKKTQYENITIARATHVNWERLTRQIDDLLTIAHRNGSSSDLLQAIKGLVPEFIHAQLQVDRKPAVIPFPLPSRR